MRITTKPSPTQTQPNPTNPPDQIEPSPTQPDDDDDDNEDDDDNNDDANNPKPNNIKSKHTKLNIKPRSKNAAHFPGRFLGTVWCPTTVVGHLTVPEKRPTFRAWKLDRQLHTKREDTHRYER